MQRPGQKRPNTPSVSKCQTDASHWFQEVREVVVRAKPDGTLNFVVRGGSDHGEFAFVVETEEGSGLLDGDILLEVQGEKVAGYTQRDVLAWLNHCCRNGNPVTLKTVRTGQYGRKIFETNYWSLFAYFFPYFNARVGIIMDVGCTYQKRGLSHSSFILSLSTVYLYYFSLLNVLFIDSTKVCYVLLFLSTFGFCLCFG